MEKDNSEVVKKEQMYIEVSSNEDEKNRLLNPTTGTEADHHWPDAEPEVPPAPLLDLPSIWKCASEGTLIPTPQEILKDCNPDVFQQNTFILVRELVYHILASTVLKPSEMSETLSEATQSKEKQPKPLCKDPLETGAVSSTSISDESDITEKTEPTTKPTEEPVHSSESPRNDDPPTSVKKADESNEKQNEPHEEKDSEATKAADENVLKSVYGACILLKLQWEDRTVQKIVPTRTYAQLADFLENVLTNLTSLLSENPEAAQPIIDSIAFTYTTLLFTRLLDGIETCTASLEKASLELLMFCAKHANPREMHIGIMAFVRKIDSIYMEATSYLIFEPLLTVWGAVILRISRKRHAFLVDFVKNYEKMNSSSEGYHHVSVPYEGGRGAEQPDLCKRVPDIVIDFFGQLTQVQNKHRASNPILQKKVDVLGRALPSFAISKTSRDSKCLEDETAEGGSEKVGVAKINNGKEEQVDKGEIKSKKGDKQETDEKKGSGTLQVDNSTAEAHDWVNERAVILAVSLQMLSVIWTRLVPPAREPRSSSSTSKSKTTASLTKEENFAEQQLCTLIRIIDGLGWTNPVLACQLATKAILLDPMTRQDDALRSHTADDVRTKKEVKKTLYGVAHVAQYAFGCLRPTTLKHLAGGTGRANDYDMSLDGTGFDLLNGNYAFDLVLPFIMNMVGPAPLTMRMIGILALRLFLARTSEDYFSSIEDVLKVRCGTRSLGREVSLFGMAQHLGVAIDSMEDAQHRVTAYETFQMVLQKCKHPLGRYSIVENVYTECVEVALAAQMITEMKDALRHSDKVAAEGKVEGWTYVEASNLKTRFVELVMPKYFLPRQEMLSTVTGIVATCNACVYVAGNDRTRLYEAEEQSPEVKSIENRKDFMKEYMKLGKSCVRALASVAEHDRKTMPASKYAKDEKKHARAVFSASGQALNQCVSSLESIKMAMEMLS